MNKKPVILCVDDEKIVLNSLKAELKGHFGEKYMIETAESGDDALEVFSELSVDGYEIILVISDYIMPKMKGDDFLIALHQTAPHIVKILLTGQANLEGITNAVNHANLYRYLTKPWERNDLLLTIEEGIKSYYKEKALEEKNITTISAEVEWIPLNLVELGEEEAQDVLKLVDKLEQDEDVQKVFHNLK